MAANTFNVLPIHDGNRFALRGDMDVALNATVNNHFSIIFFTVTNELFNITTDRHILGLDGDHVQSLSIGGRPGLYVELMYDVSTSLWYIVSSELSNVSQRKLIGRLPWEPSTGPLPAPGPTIVLNIPSSNVVVNTTLSLTATVVDSNVITRVEFYKNGSLMTSDPTSPYSTTDSLTSANNGTITYVAKLIDSTGTDITSISRDVVVNIPVQPPVVTDNTAPSIVLASNVTSVTTDQTITLTATASDAVGVVKVEFYKNGALLSTDTTAPFIAQIALTSASNGTIAYTAKAYDAANNSTLSNVINVTVNVAPPAIISDMTLSAGLNTAINTARDAAALGSKRMAVAQAIVDNMKPSHTLNVYRNAVLIAPVTFTGDCVITDDGFDVKVGLGVIATSTVNQNADINTGAWTFTVAGGSSGQNTIQGTVGPVGSGKNIILADSPSTTQPFDVDIVFTIPRAIDGLT